MDSKEDCQRIQQDIDRLETWAEKWQMEFNLVEGPMHVGIIQ